MAIYAADIQINVKNKGELRTLESRFKKIETAAVSLSKTLKGLGRRNAIKVDTRAAMSAISALEARIRGLNRTVNIDARTRESRSGGGGGGAAIPLAAAAFSGGMGRRGMDSFERITKKQMDYVDQRIAQIERKFDTRAASAKNPIAAKMETLKNRRRVLGDEARAIQNDFQTRLKQQSFRQLRRDIAASEGRYQDLLASPPPKPRSKFEGLTRQTRKAWVDDLRAERGFGNKLKSQLPDAFEAGAGPTRQIEDKLGKINELARQQANLKKVAEGENQVTQARVKGNAVRNKVRTLEDKIEQSQVNVARSQSKGEKISEDLAKARDKQAEAQTKLNKVQKSFDTREANKRNKLQLEKGLAKATQDRAKAEQELTKWTKAQQKQLDRYGPNVRRDYSKPGGAIDKSKQALSKANRDIAEIEQKLSKVKRVSDFSKPLNDAKQKFKGIKAEADALGQALDRNNRRLAQGNQILNRRTGIQKRQKFMGAAGRGAAASMALIPGVAPLAVGGFAGAAGGGGLAGGGIGVAVAAAVQGTVALVEFARASAQVAAEMDRMRIALGGVVPDQESYNNSLDKVSKISNKYAISQRTILKGFTQLQASADAAGFGVEDTGKLMEGLLARTLASGKGIEEFKGVMLAASQILSKGKLQAEEARGQIGERIPGFMADLAASMNISMKELDKAMEQGEVTLKDFFKLGEDLLKNNEKIALVLAKSYANAGARLEASTEKLQIALGARSMIIGAKFQQGLKIVADLVTNVVKGLNAWRIAELKLGIAIRRRIRSAMGKDPDANLNEFELRDREELRILTGEQKILTKERKKQIADDIKDAAQKAANWKKIEERLKIDTQFQKDRISLGQKEAEIQRELAELRLQFEGKDLTEIEKKIRALKDLENQTMSNSAAFKELQESAAQNLRDLSNPINQLRVLTEAFQDSFSNAIKEVIRGSMSIGDAITSMLNRIADAMAQNAADMAASAATNALLKIVGSAFASSFGNSLSTNTTLPTDVGGLTWKQAVDMPAIKYASGGYVDRPTNAVIGEGGEGEYVIPESKLASSLSRFQAGHRGSSVVPGGVGSSGGSGGGSGEVTVNYTGPTLNFNGDEYVPRSAVPQIINSAARAGASAGRANTMKDLKNSRSQRARLGL